MTRKIRLTQRRDLLIKGKAAAQKKVEDKIRPLFVRQFKRLERELRKGNLRKKLNKIDLAKRYNVEQKDGDWVVMNTDTGEMVTGGNHGEDKEKAESHLRALYANVEDASMEKVSQFFKVTAEEEKQKEQWSAWKKALLLALLLGLFSVADDLAELENEIWTSRGMEPLTYDAETLIQEYQFRTGRPLSDIGDATILAVQVIIADWYSADAPFATLMRDLERYFNETRIRMIADTEVGNLSSQMILWQMKSYNLSKWRWVHVGEDTPCEQCLELNGKIFQRGDPMPPDASHPNCHCQPLPLGI